MKKVIIVFISLIVAAFLVISIGKYFVEREIIQRDQAVDEKWNLLKNDVYLHAELLSKINESNKYISNDSLNLIMNNQKMINECTLDFSENEYYLNKLVLKIKADSLSNDNDLNALESSHKKLNHLILNYDTAARNYNDFITSFPLSLYTFKRYKTKECFELKYGIENKNPKTKYDEVPDWMLEIEKSKGL